MAKSNEKEAVQTETITAAAPDVTATVQAAVAAGQPVELPAGEHSLSETIQLPPSGAPSVANEQADAAPPTSPPPPPPPGVKIITLDPKERAFIEKKEAKRQALLDTAEERQAAQERQRRALYEHLAVLYPLTETAHGRVWRHADLGEVRYIEVAINGKFFDPRGVDDDYRPDLDYPSFDQEVDAMVVG